MGPHLVVYWRLASPRGPSLSLLWTIAPLPDMVMSCDVAMLAHGYHGDMEMFQHKYNRIGIDQKPVIQVKIQVKSEFTLW